MTDHPPLSERILTLVKHPQFYWWLGHVCLVLNAILYFTSVLSLHPYTGYYKRAHAGSLISYGIVIWKSVGIPRRFDMEFIGNENVQYFALAFYWYSYRPITVTLVPFFIFSLFHMFAYIPSAITPVLFPKDSNSNSTVAQACQSIKEYTDEHHEMAMQLAAYVEVVGVMGQLLLGVISFQTSILALIVFAHFLRLRYYLSPYTREALHETTEKLDQWILPLAHDPRRWAQISCKLYVNIKAIVIRYGSATTTSHKNSNSNSSSNRSSRVTSTGSGNGGGSSSRTSESSHRR
ncbi:hypothetical protein BDB00DRAFT_973141 [Zychaea mexicana]|uniref:uncharacterized protein n=1 Tax=Zychaea mexicana TaxID=64656 RepID=UPI0022FDD967|nr:uncharacterized protein BDB00DRAFT_973141 [Zychaea mexicana]KAI9495420.1 hypothetical protein BDB00DRAFT_973141 [Zychaea mexicana]